MCSTLVALLVASRSPRRGHAHCVLRPGLSQERPVEALPLPASSLSLSPRPCLPQSPDHRMSCSPHASPQPLYPNSISCGRQDHPEPPPGDRRRRCKARAFRRRPRLPREAPATGLRPTCTWAPTGVQRHLCSWHKSTFSWKSLAFSFPEPHCSPRRLHIRTLKGPSLRHGLGKHRAHDGLDTSHVPTLTSLALNPWQALRWSTLARPENTALGS